MTSIINHANLSFDPLLTTRFRCHLPSLALRLVRALVLAVLPPRLPAQPRAPILARALARCVVYPSRKMTMALMSIEHAEIPPPLDRCPPLVLSAPSRSTMTARPLLHHAIAPLLVSRQTSPVTLAVAWPPKTLMMIDVSAMTVVTAGLAAGVTVAALPAVAVKAGADGPDVVLATVVLINYPVLPVIFFPPVFCLS